MKNQTQISRNHKSANGATQSKPAKRVRIKVLMPIALERAVRKGAKEMGITNSQFVELAISDRLGECEQLADSGAIFFNELYDHIREKNYDDAVSEFAALLEVIRYHPGLKEERPALELIKRGDTLLNKCYSVWLSGGFTNQPPKSSEV
jgi:ketol-acid reductoisomerase